jgi:hypothetical protein
MKKVLIGFLALTLVMSFSMAYATPLVYTNVRPVTIGATSDPVGSCPGYANCELQTLLSPMFNHVGDTDQQAAGYWQLGGINPNMTPTVAFEITANSNTMQMGVFSVNGGDTTSPKTLVDIFLGPAAAGASAVLTFNMGTGAMTISRPSTVPVGAVNEGTFAGITTSGFGFYIQPAGDVPSGGNPINYPTYYILDQLNGGLAQMVAFRNPTANRWTLAFEDTPIRNATGGLNGDYDYNDFIFQIESITPVPEPMTLLLLGLGLLGVAGIRRKFKSSKS